MENRIYLRALNPEDYILTYKWRQDPIYKKGVASQNRFINLETEKKWMQNAIARHEQGKEVRLAIIEKETDSFIGMIFLTNINYVNRTAGIGSLIGQDESRGKGYIYEARLKLFDYAFKELGLQRIEAKILRSNKRSLKAVEKFGYVQEGILRKAIYKNGEFKDLIVFSMLKEEFYRVHGNNVVNL